MNKIFILSLGTSVPPVALKQAAFAKAYATSFALTEEEDKSLSNLFAKTKIEKRHSVIEDYSQNPFAGELFEGMQDPSMGRRNAIYKREAPKLAHAAAEVALENWGGAPDEITHVVSISCTGVLAPGLEFLLVDSLKLKRSVERLGLNFMGCFGAFRGLALARAFAKESPKNRILVVCTELCSLHLQEAVTKDQLIANSLFSDGAAAFVLGGDPRGQEKPLWSIEEKTSLALGDSLESMTWEAGDNSFTMRLSQEVPEKLYEVIAPFIEDLLSSRASISDCIWAPHPGGKAILLAIARALSLESSELKHSWDILKNYGNMSSATFLFVLEKIWREGIEKRWTVGMGFGPGLSLEGILLEKAEM